MTKNPLNPFDDDKAFGDFLHQHDLIVPPAAVTLAALEDRIMAQADARPQSLVPRSVFDSAFRSVPAGLGWLPGMAEQPWALRSAGLLAVLVLLLGFTIGRDFDVLSAENTDNTEQAALFASAGGSPWQSFITTASAGETDDTTDDSGE